MPKTTRNQAIIQGGRARLRQQLDGVNEALLAYRDEMVLLLGHGESTPELRALRASVLVTRQLMGELSGLLPHQPDEPESRAALTAIMRPTPV